MNFVFFFTFIFVLFSAFALGSFVNMAAYRIPRELSIVAPRSYCDHCKQPLSILALVPILGYILLGGKCARCKEHIPLQYPLVEALSGVFCIFAFFYYDAFSYLPFSFRAYVQTGLFIQLLTACWLFFTGLLLSIIDLKYRILPDIIVIPGIFIGLVLGSFNPEIGFQQSLLGAIVGGFGLFIVSKLYELIRKKEGIGFGDVKYLAFLGASLGVYGVVFTIFLASILGSVIGILALFFMRKDLHTPIPFGPFLAVAGLVYFLLSKNFTII